MKKRRDRSSFQLGWRLGREDYDNGQVGDALAAWRALRQPYRSSAPDLLSFTEGYARGAFMSPRNADLEILRSERWIEKRR
jgi:hypothetical protein